MGDALPVSRDPYGLSLVGKALLSRDDSRQSIRYLRLAVEESRGAPAYTVDLAWVLASSADPALRDGPAALRLLADAEGIRNPTRRAQALCARAVALAAEEPQRAIETAERARQLARRIGAPRLETVADRTLRSLRAGEPVRLGPRIQFRLLWPWSFPHFYEIR